MTMCDGTPCPCNLYPPGHPDSRWPNGRPARAPKVRRAAVKTGTVGSVALIVLAFVHVVTGWGFLGIVGPAVVGVVLLAFLVAAVAGACELGPRLAARHRAAARESRR